MAKYFIKETNPGLFNKSFEIGYIDMEKRDEDGFTFYKATTISIDQDKDYLSIRKDGDIIPENKMADLHYITEENYNKVLNLMNELISRTEEIIKDF